MAYPIIPKLPGSYYKIYLNYPVMSSWAIEDWSDYASAVSFSYGNTVDFRRPTFDVGNGTFVFKDSIFDSSRKYNTIIVVSVSKKSGVIPYTIYQGKITDIDVVKEVKNGSVTEKVTIQTQDMTTYFFNDTYNVEAFKPSLGETTTTDVVKATFPTTYISTGNSTINGGVVEDNVINQLQIIGDTLLQYPRFMVETIVDSVSGIPYSFVTAAQPYWSLVPYSNATTPTMIASDGTHTSGSPTLFYTDINVSSSSKSIATMVQLNNIGLKRGTYPTGNTVALQSLDIPYSTGSNGRLLELKTAAVSDNLGWNFLTYTCNNMYRPLWRTTGQHKMNAGGPIRNSKPTAIITATNTFTGAAAIYLNDDLSEVFALNPGGTTGNYYFRCYMATVTGRTVSFTPRIEWYDSSDTFISLVNGTAVALNTNWQALTVNAAKPSNAAYGVATLVTSNSFAKTTTVAYVSDAYFGRSGGYFSFDGDYPDTSTYAYTWTDTRWESPSQLNNASNVSTLANNWLTRASIATPVARTVTFNMASAPTTFHKIIDSLHDHTRPYQSADNLIRIWFNGSDRDYDIVGYNVNLNLDDSNVTFTLLDKG